MKSTTGRAAILTTALATGLIISTASAATFVWDGGPSGTGTDLGVAANWSPDGTPTGSTSDILRWNGTVAGDLSLTYATSSTIGNSPGISIDVTASQTGNLTVDGTVSGGLRLGSGGVTIANGAGAFSLGNGSGTFNITSFNGALAMTNNSANAATIKSDVVFATTFAGTTAFNFGGTGDWLVNTNLKSTNSTGNSVANNGTGTLTMGFGSATYTGGTSIGPNGGASVIRATASGALGTGNVQINGNGGSNRLELSGGITLANAVNANGKGNGLGQAAAILNVSGNNILSNTFTVNVGGSNGTVQSDSGQLTFSGATSISSLATGTRGILFTGAGDINVTGAIVNGSSSGLVIDKQGAGTLTLGGANTYTGATTVSAGTLFVNGSLGNTAVAVTAGTLGGSGSITGTVAVTGTGSLSAGTSIESLVVGGLSMATGTTFVYEAANNSSTGADLVAVAGTLSLSDVTLDLSGANLADFSWMAGEKITLISYTGLEITSGFSGYDDNTVYTFGTNQWIFDYNDANPGNNFAGDTAPGSSFVTMTVVPEPSAVLLGGFGLLALMRRRRP